MAIVVYAAASWVAFINTALVYPSYHYRLPSLLVVLIALAVLFSAWNDNHEVRKGLPDPASYQRPSVGEHFGRWHDDRRTAWESRHPGRPFPVVIVAAEGGGIRAAYWTASVLARLEDAVPGFACHLFGVSGASGGSLGGAVFASLVADRAERTGAGCRPTGDSTSFLDPTRDVLSEDFLGPALAGMLFPDLMQRFSPVPDLFPDRASYLEQAWEAAWRKHAGSDRFGENFRELWRGRALEVPSLFLNGTWVETGGRNVTSNLRPDSAEFVMVEDAFARLDRTIRLSTAVHMSARFTYVSPAGTMPDGQRRVVDGGYFENSGAMTAAEVLGALLAEDPAFTPVVLIISNRPSDPGTGKTNRFFHETLAPIQTLLNARGARGARAEIYLEREALNAGGHSLRFALAGSARAPLGWMLSETTRDAIDDQVESLAVDLIRGILNPQRP